MKSVININKLFPKPLFWDLDMCLLDAERDCDLIIPRALIVSTLITFVDDFSKLEQIYSRAIIAYELKQTKERISDQICKLVARRYHIKQFSRFFK